MISRGDAETRRDFAMLSSKYTLLEKFGLICLAGAAASVIIQVTESQFAAGMMLGIAIWECCDR